ncbi:MAG: NAD(P)-dependent oxidoreductase [Patescibacteria group bacterium]
MHILLLGGSGRLGNAMQRLWTDHTIVAPEPTEVDILNAEQLAQTLDTVKPELVVNTAAYNNVDGAEGAEREICFTLNAEAPGLLARLTAERNLPFIHFSTDYIFDGTKQEGYIETDEPAPLSAYGQSKLEGEQNALRDNPRTYIIRTSRLYGPAATFAGAKPSFIELIIRDAQHAESFLVNRAEVSAPTHVDDLTRHIAEHILPLQNAPGIYHMSNQGGATWFEWASEIIDILKLPVTISPRDPATMTRAAKRPDYSIIVSTKLPSMRPWQEALRAYLTSRSWEFKPVWQPSK